MPDSTITLRTRAELQGVTQAVNAYNALDAAQQKLARDSQATAQSLAKVDAALKGPTAGAAAFRAALQNAAVLDPRQAVAGFNQIVSLEKQATIEADKAAKAIKGLGTNNGLAVLPRTIAGLSGEALNAAKSFIALKVATEGLDFIKSGAEITDVTTSFNNLSKAAGTTGDALLGSLRAASNSTITDASLIKSANLGLLLTQGRIAKDLPALTQIAQASAKATGQTVDFVFESLVKGISRGSAKIIDNAGITLDGEKAYAEYAASIGKTSDQLTKAEQQQAVLNAVVKEGNQIVKDAGINANDASVKIAQAQTALENLKNAAAQKIAPTAAIVATGLTNKINTGTTQPGANAEGGRLQGNLVAQAQSYDQYTASVKAANAAVFDAIKATDPLGALYARTFLGLSALSPAQYAYAQSLIATGTASQTAFAQAQGLSDVSDRFTKALNSATTAALGNRTELTALAPRILEVANQSEHNTTAVDGLLAAYAAGRESLPGLIAALNSLSQANDIQRLASQEEEREARRLAQSFDAIVPSANAAQAAIAGALGAANAPLPHLNDRTAGAIGSILGGGIAGGAGGLSSRQDQANNALQDSRDALALSKSKTLADKIAIYQRRLDQQTTEEGRNKYQTLINNLRNGASSGAAGGKGLGALDRVDISLAGDYQAQLDAVNAKLAAGHLTELQTKQLKKEQLDLQKKIADEQERANNAALDARIAAIENRKKDREDARRLAAAQAVLANPNAFSAEQRTNAADLVELLPLEQQKRNNDVAAKAREAGIAIPTGAALPIATAPGAALPTTQAPVQQLATNGANGTPLILQLDGKDVGSILLPFIIQGLSARTQPVRAAGG